MLSEQVDRLGEIADFLESDPRTQATAPEVRRAADTIWELRNKLAGVVDQSEEIERLKAESSKLRELCSELLRMAESSDPEWLHWPELHDELRELGVEK